MGTKKAVLGNHMSLSKFLLCTLLFCSWIESASAQKKLTKSRQLDRGAAVRVEDATTSVVHQTDVEQLFRYEKTGEDEDLFLLEINLNHGFTERLQGRAFVPLILGNANETGSRDIGAGFLYALRESDSNASPSISISASARSPTGVDSRGIDGALGLLMTQGLGEERHAHRVHLNLSFKPNSNPLDQEANYGYEVVTGYDTAISENHAFILSLMQELEVYEDKKIRVLEGAVRTELSDVTTLGSAIGTGLDALSPGFRFSFTFQRIFN